MTGGTCILFCLICIGIRSSNFSFCNLSWTLDKLVLNVFFYVKIMMILYKQCMSYDNQSSNNAHQHHQPYGRTAGPQSRVDRAQCMKTHNSIQVRMPHIES